MDKVLKPSGDCVFSIIIPVLNEQNQINNTLEHLRNNIIDKFCQIIVVDGDPDGQTIKTIKDNNVIKLTSQPGRACQMNAGADTADGEILIFLHADTQLPHNALKNISQVMENGKYVGGAFELKIDSGKIFLKYVAARASFRSRLNRIPYGDQAVFIRKEYFEEIGGYKDIPIMEDIDLMRRIKKRGDKICIMGDRVITSARRWEKQGFFYTTIKNQVLLILYYLGVSPHKLAKLYKKHYE